MVHRAHRPLSGSNPDSTKAPHVINNSWGCPPIEGCTTPDILPDAGHPFLATSAGFQSEAPHLKRFVPGDWDTMGAWLKSHLGLR